MGPSEAGSRLPGSGSMQVMGNVRVRTWTAIRDWQPTRDDAAPGGLGARAPDCEPTRVWIQATVLMASWMGEPSARTPDIDPGGETQAMTPSQG